jgi:DNA polymerase-3 subunit beta
MEFRIPKQTLLKGLSRIQAIVEKRNTMPILANTLIEAEDEKVFITATDLDVGIRGSYDATVAKKGSVTVAAKKLYEVVRELPDENITVSRRDNNWVEVTCGKIVFRLVGLAAEEFPALPKADDKNLVRIESAILLSMIEKSLYAVSSDEARYNLNGVYFESRPDEGILRFVATDGHRLALVDRKLEGTDLGRFEKGLIFPKKGIYELKRLLEEDNDPVEIGLRKTTGVIRKRDVLLVVRLIDGEFPDYNQVIPKDAKRTLTVAREPLLAALRRISILASEKSRAVKLDLGKKRLELSSNNPDLGEAREELEVDYAGENLSIGFNARYLLDALSVFDSKEVRLGLNDELSPGTLRPADDDAVLAVVMPMRI